MIPPATVTLMFFEEHADTAARIVDALGGSPLEHPDLEVGPFTAKGIMVTEVPLRNLEQMIDQVAS